MGALDKPNGGLFGLGQMGEGDTGLPNIASRKSGVSGAMDFGAPTQGPNARTHVKEP